MDDDAGPGGRKPWFRAKRYGYGAGLPIAWQGRALLGGFIAAFLALMMALTRLIQQGSGLAVLPVAAMIAVLVLFARTCQQRSDRDWRWRWGNDA